MSKKNSLISLDYDNSNNLNTNPTAKYNYSANTTFFNHFLPNMGGIEYSYYSTTPNITIKTNEKLRDIGQYYSKRLIITKQIHAFSDVSVKDLELIIEHIPDKKNLNQTNLYTCFGFNTDPDKRNNSDGFTALFQGINIDNINASITNTNQASVDNLKQSYVPIQFNSALIKNKSKDTTITPDAFYYLDSSLNIFIVYNRPFSIVSEQYKMLCSVLRPIPYNKVFEKNTNLLPYPSGAVFTIPFQNGNLQETVSKLKEGFVSLREGAKGLMGNYVYCKPADSSNGNHITTAAINELANNSKNNVLLNDITMVFTLMVVLFAMCFISPIWYIKTNQFLKFNIKLLWVFRILAILFIFGGGFVIIILSRTVAGAPDWLFMVGLIMMLCFSLFYLVVFSFQKNTIYTQINDIMMDEPDKDIKKTIHDFLYNQFGDL